MLPRQSLQTPGTRCDAARQENKLEGHCERTPVRPVRPVAPVSPVAPAAHAKFRSYDALPAWAYQEEGSHAAEAVSTDTRHQT